MVRTHQLPSDFLARTPGACEWCGDPVSSGELIRVQGIPVVICAPCRREWRTGKKFTLENALAWTCRIGAFGVRPAIERRISRMGASRDRR